MSCSSSTFCLADLQFVTCDIFYKVADVADSILGEPVFFVLARKISLADPLLTHTCKTSNSWWQVDLEATKEIDSVQLWNRGDCCRFRLSNFYIRFLDESGNEVKNMFHAGGLEGDQWTQIFHPGKGIFARYVKVQLTAGEALSLTEVG